MLILGEPGEIRSALKHIILTDFNIWSIKIHFKRLMNHMLYIYIVHCILQLMYMKEKAKVSVY